LSLVEVALLGLVLALGVLVVPLVFAFLALCSCS